MTRIKTTLFIIAAIAVVANIAFFKMYLGLTYIGLPLYAIVAIYYINLWASTINIYPKSDAVRLDQKEPGEIRHYKSNATFIVIFFMTLIVVLALISAIMMTMLCRQKEIHYFSVLTQLGLSFGGWMLTCLFSVAYNIGRTYDIGYSESERRKEARIKRDQECYMEAVEVVKKILIDKLCVESESVVPTASLYADLGADDLDVVEMLWDYDKYLSEKYNGGVLLARPHIKNSADKRMQCYLESYWLHHKICTDTTIDDEERFKRLDELNYLETISSLYPTVKDHYEFLTTFIKFYRPEESESYLKMLHEEMSRHSKSV